MIRNESEKRIDLKKKDMKKTRKKLNTLPTVQPVFGTSLCILERLDMIKGRSLKKRENVGIFKKQGGGGLPESNFIFLLFLTWETPQQ